MGTMMLFGLLIRGAFADEVYAADPCAEADPAAERCEPPDVDLEGLEPVKTYFHGFRVGYTYVNGLSQGSPLHSPHLFVIGYEGTQRAVGGRWLNVIAVENVSIAGINQSVFIPSLNGLVGFEIDEQVQIGTGLNVNPFDPSGKYVHQIVAVGWTPPAGAFNVPLHVTFIPDVDGNWRAGTTIGVNW